MYIFYVKILGPALIVRRRCVRYYVRNEPTAEQISILETGNPSQMEKFRLARLLRLPLCPTMCGRARLKVCRAQSAAESKTGHAGGPTPGSRGKSNPNYYDGVGQHLAVQAGPSCYHFVVCFPLRIFAFEALPEASFSFYEEGALPSPPSRALRDIPNQYSVCIYLCWRANR